jgi:DNA polymerase III epsilon subunit-like protein
VGQPQAPAPCFSTVVSVDATFNENHGAKAGEIHGILPEEIAQGPDFANAFGEFVSFVDRQQKIALETDNESEDEEEAPDMPRIAEVPPRIVIVAHNGVKYDFAMLLCECERNKLPWGRMGEWLFVDTLHIFEAIPMDLGGCKKLRCVSRFCGGCEHGMAAHRALADTMALRAALVHIAQCLSVSVEELIRPFCQRLDVDVSARYLSYLSVHGV